MSSRYPGAEQHGLACPLVLAEVETAQRRQPGERPRERPGVLHEISLHEEVL